VNSSLSVDDFVQILTSTDACLTRQYQALLATEGVELEFEESGIRRLAEIAWQVNEKTENIGARRLYTVMEKLLEEVSFDARSGSCKIDANYVDGKLDMLSQRRPGPLRTLSFNSPSASAPIWALICFSAR
jgi:ATP-dependent HslUV protease ATP-binding subunit HslU